VGRNADYTDDEWESTKTALVSRKSSNLARLLESGPGKKHIGISISKNGEGKIPYLSSDPKWALKVLRRVVEDVRDGIVDSRDLNKASDIEAYFTALPKELQPQKGKSVKAKAFQDIDLKKRAKGAATSSGGAQKTKRAPKPRTTLAPKRHPFNAPSSTKGQRLLGEAGMIDAGRFTISAAFVLRGFVELAINDYMDSHSIPKHEKNAKGQPTELDLSKKCERVVQHIVAADGSKNSDLKGFRNNLMTKTAAASIQSLNGFVHNKFQIPTPDALRAGWDSSVPLFIETYGSI
jgi:hypothetical protein